MKHLVRAARAMAVKAHGNQKYGEHPYVRHLDEVAEICEPHGATAQIAAYLHDALEDTSLSPLVVEGVFGWQVHAIVEAVTDSPGHNRKERKAVTYARLAEIEAGSPIGLALIVKAADRLANVRACDRDQNARLMSMYRDEHRAFHGAVFRESTSDLLEEVEFTLRWTTCLPGDWVW